MWGGEVLSCGGLSWCRCCGCCCCCCCCWPSAAPSGRGCRLGWRRYRQRVRAGSGTSPCKCANILENNKAQYLHYASLFTSSFVQKCMMKEVNILSPHLSFQANMDGDEGELVQQKIFFSSNNKLKYGKSKSVYETIVILVLNNEKKTYILQNALIHLRPHPCSPENLSERTVYLPLSSYTFARTSM